MNVLRVNEYGGKHIFCEAHRRGKKGTWDVESPTDELCPCCERERKEAEHPMRVREAMLHPNYMFGRRTSYGSIRIVHRDPSSPSGRRAAEWCEPEMFAQLQAELGRSSRPQPQVQLGE